jgi:hypothetical protein
LRGLYTTHLGVIDCTHRYIILIAGRMSIEPTFAKAPETSNPVHKVTVMPALAFAFRASDWTGLSHR